MRVEQKSDRVCVLSGFGDNSYFVLVIISRLFFLAVQGSQLH